MVRITIIRGKGIDVDKISNLKLRRVVQNRCRDFMFSYSDVRHTEHTDVPVEHTEYKDYDDKYHTEHSEK
jgi:hypothetical protein